VTDYQHWPGIHEQVIHHADKMEQFELAFKDAILEVLGPQDAGIWTLRSHGRARAHAL